jgi:hypothetical protein
MKYGPVNLNDSDKNFINDVILSESFPWYKQSFQTDFIPNKQIKDQSTNTFFFSHALMLRNKVDSTVSGSINSDYFPFFLKIFYKWIDDNQLSRPSKIYRAGLNLTTYNDKDFSVPHFDHEWNHWNWIMYLNDSTAPTLLFDQNYNIINEFPAKKFHACAFPNTLHAHRFPKIGELRYVCVFTFI